MTSNDPTRLLQASLGLSASLLAALDEASCLRAVMRAGCEVLGAEGCFFTPFDEYSQRLPVLEYGVLPVEKSGQISQPEIRQRCKLCETRQSGGECIRLRGGSKANRIHCALLRNLGREAGLFSFLLPYNQIVDESLEIVVAEFIHLAELSLDALERTRMIQAVRYSSLPPDMTEQDRTLSSQIEYRAILGERTRLAREIHDGLAQSLAYLKIEIGRAEALLTQEKTDQAARILKDSSRTINDTYLDARQAIENLRRSPDHLDIWLQQVAEDFEELSGMAVKPEIQLDTDLPPDVQIQLIRIVQEALTNVRKHARAEHVWVKASHDGRNAVITVEDDGSGFNPSDPLVGNRYGLRGMRERAEAIGAELEIISRPGGGTSISLIVPIKAGALP